MLLSLLAAFLLGNIMLKNLVERSRPCWIYPEVGLLIRIPRDYSFPSGHSMVGFAGATAVWKMNKGWGVAALILAGSIAFSRLYLFVHWPSDVLIGSIIGILLAILIFEIENRVRTGKEKLERYENV
ncbi:MAG: phosphatase PAP2 family protein [Clostridiales bacterium]|nr:phosphatase PAP2 family protein [Clostridiales bacterium]